MAIGVGSVLELWSILVWFNVIGEGLLSLRKPHIFQLCIHRLRSGFAASVLKGNLRNSAVNRELVVEAGLRERNGASVPVMCRFRPLSRRFRMRRCFHWKLIFRLLLLIILKRRRLRLLQFKLRFLLYGVIVKFNFHFSLLIDPVVRIHIIHDVWKENGPFCFICT